MIASTPEEFARELEGERVESQPPGTTWLQSLVELNTAATRIMAMIPFKIATIRRVI